MAMRTYAPAYVQTALSFCDTYTKFKSRIDPALLSGGLSSPDLASLQAAMLALSLLCPALQAILRKESY